MHLYISDLDKTLLNDNAQLSAYAKEEINRMVADGLQFTIATARSHVSAKYILGDLDLRLPVIVANGSFMCDYETGNIISRQGIENEYKEDILQLIQQNGLSPFVSASRGSILKLFFQDALNEGEQWYINDLEAAQDPRRTHLAKIEDALEYDVVSFTCIAKAEAARSLEKLIHEQFPDKLDIHHYENPYHPGWHWMSIHDHRATKGNMVETLVEHLDWDMASVSVFGDNVNDIPMFKTTGNGYAVSNAAEVLKECAAGIIGSNMENGVVQYIKSKFYTV